MIGGIDIGIPSRAGDLSLEVAVRPSASLARSGIREWPCRRAVRSLPDIPFGEIEEIFVYRDAASAESLGAEGAIPERIQPGWFTSFTTKDWSPRLWMSRTAEMKEIIAAMKSRLNDAICGYTATLRVRAA